MKIMYSFDFDRFSSNNYLFHVCNISLKEFLSYATDPLTIGGRQQLKNDNI
jgi:hypothetical protein